MDKLTAILGALGLRERRSKPRWAQNVTDTSEREQVLKRLMSQERRLQAIDAEIDAGRGR